MCISKGSKNVIALHRCENIKQNQSEKEGVTINPIHPHRSQANMDVFNY